ncbi:MAG TPA: glycosyltransferase family 87 protein [Planctomycetota bacterium]|nr:glycosyltransferase family 87 protein [Planctomycetota bacterium]
MRRTTLLWAAVVLVAGVFGWADVRQRARLDRGTRYHRTDFTVYQAAALALRTGEDPYEARSPRGYRYLYPPLLAVLLMPVAGWASQDAAVLFYALSVAALASAAVGTMRVAGVRATVLAGIVCAPFFVQTLQRGQVTILLLALQVGALTLLVRGRPAGAGLALGIGGALRLTPLLPGAALVAGAIALGRGGRATVGRVAGGLAAGLVLGLVVVPVAALGPSQAAEVSGTWVRMTTEVYGPKMRELDEDAINEYRFKNQAPRRVFATYAGWATGATFEKEQPALAPGVRHAVDAAAGVVAAAACLLALLLGWRRLRDPAAPGFAAAFGAVVLLPVLATRYTWPTHYVMALPALALAIAGSTRAGAIVFAAGTALFYAAHAAALEPLGAAGPLLAGCMVLLVALIRRTLLGSAWPGPEPRPDAPPAISSA